MSKQKCNILILLLTASFQHSLSFAQKTNFSSNRNNGTYLINYSPISIFLTETDTVLCGISVQFYELGKDSLKKINGNVYINGNKYATFDSIGVTDEEGYKYPDSYFGKRFKESVFILKADAGFEYYPIKTEKLFLWPKSDYNFRFYFIRKDELKKN